MLHLKLNLKGLSAISTIIIFLYCDMDCHNFILKYDRISLIFFFFMKSLISFLSSDLSQRVDSVKEENLKLKSENQVLGQYIENLMSASSVFQCTSPKTKKK